ncbi:hypothetical protein CHS0354_014148 [Potamilus streckersoni]|uniref:C2H2-type domain-containing protein n=1 Tax=Potamilus streckersoni TaxID=2493646 RepID=A0AAE0TK01_9BIVA|nr:hypothetical protein CHS0354_014148 [Potamilus streckersoni]
MAMAPNSEEITCGIQKAIVTLCMEAYSSGTEVEIDGIICLRDTKYKQYEVVKIHKTFIKPDLGNASLTSFGNATFGNGTLAGFENPCPGRQTTMTTENNASSNSAVMRDRDKTTNPCSVSSKEMTGPFSFNRKETTVRKYELCEEKQKQFLQHSKVVSEEVILDSPVSHNGYMYSSKDGDDSDKQANDLEKPFTSKPVALNGQNMSLDHKTVNTTTLQVVATDCKRETVQVDRRPTTVVKDDQIVSSELLMEISTERKEDEKEAEDEKKEGEREEQNRTFNEVLEDDGDCIIVKIEAQDEDDDVVALREIPISSENLAFHLTSFDSQKQSSMNLGHGRKRSQSNTYILDTKKSAGTGSDLSENQAGNQSGNSLAHDDIHGGFHRNVFYSSHDNTLISSIELNDCMSGGIVGSTPPMSKLQKLMSPNTSDSETRFSCFLCGMQFVTKSNLFRHMRSSCKLVGRKAPCQVCGKMLLDRPDNLKEHMLSQHGVERNLKDLSDVDEVEPLPRS